MEQKIIERIEREDREAEKRLQAAYNKMSEKDKKAGLVPEDFGFRADYLDINGNYIEDRFDPDYYDGDDLYYDGDDLIMVGQKYGQKYGITNHSITIKGADNKDHILHEIVAVKDFETVHGNLITAGEKGGFIESEKNLSQEGSCWIDCAGVYGNAKVCDNAWVSSGASVGENAIVSGNAIVAGVEVSGNAVICDNARVVAVDNVNCVEITGNTKICGNATLSTSEDVFDFQIVGGTTDKDMYIVNASYDLDNLDRGLHPYVLLYQQKVIHLEELLQQSQTNVFEKQPEQNKGLKQDSKKDVKSQEQGKDKKARTRQKGKSR